MTPFAAWANFYDIAGTTAGALIGLQFVALTLMATTSSRISQDGAAAYSTPTTIHFSAAFFLSALMLAPWPSLIAAAAPAAAIGLAGTLYALITWRRMRRQANYKPYVEDWLFHALLPFAAYVLLLAGAVGVAEAVYAGMFGVGAAALLLILIGIHNAWDMVTYHIFVNMKREPGA